MTEHERDEHVSAAYRRLGREEPRAELDAAILAAARRRRRWAVPVSIAAVVVLAVGVALRLQLERPEVSEPVALEPRRLEAPATPPVASSAAKQETRADAAPRERAPSAPAPQAAAPAPAPESTERRSAAGNVAVGKIRSIPETPEQWLERIARLRAEGKDPEADESLAAFKRRYPDFEIPAAMRERIERR